MDYNKPTEEFLRSIDIHELLPQQEPFVMIGCLTEYDNNHIMSETLINEANIFADDNTFSPSGLMENIAQTCAARIGYINKFILKKGIQIGVIGAIKNFSIAGFPKIGDVITTTVTVKDEVFGVTLAYGEILCKGKVLVTTDIKIAIRQAQNVTNEEV